MKAFYGSRISENITLSPEGFLICRNVPIARTGWQDYLAGEVGLEGSDIVKVYRSEREVFAPATMASFEGKPVTSNHPSAPVDPSNFSAYAKGHAQNVRRGAGGDSDKLLADLIINDAMLIGEIEGGKREISCGYECEYEQDSQGRVQQTEIRGNHVAVVSEGRAGNTVQIQDEKPERGKDMAKKTHRDARKNLLGRMLTAFAKDEDTTPEEVADAAEELTAVDEDVVAEPTEDNETTETTDQEVMLDGLVDKIVDKVVERIGSAGAPAADNSLEQLEDELSETVASEAENTVPSDVVDEEESAVIDSDETEAADEDETMDEDETAQTAVADAALRMIRSMKPALAKLPPKERKQMSDAMNSSLRKVLGKPGMPKQKGYAKIVRDSRAAAQRRSASSAPNIDCSKLDEVYASRNPHAKK